MEVLLKDTDLFVSWRESLNQSCFEEAIAFEREAEASKATLSNNKKEEFLILSSRNAIYEKDYQKLNRNLLKLETYITNGTEETQYYFNYLNGVKNSHAKQYGQAVYYYKLAEKQLNSISSLNEKADLYYRLALAYYETNKITLSIQNVNAAYDLFSSVKHYKGMANAQLLLGSNHNELRQYTEAEMHYNKALTYSQKVNYVGMEKMVHHNLGYLYSTQGKSVLAIKFLELSLKESDSLSPELLKSYFLLSRENYRNNDLETGTAWYNKALQLAETLNRVDYKYHLRAIKTSFAPDQNSCNAFESEIIEIINYFTEQESWDFVAEYSDFLATYFKDQEQFEEACEYYELANLANIKSTSKGDLI